MKKILIVDDDVSILTLVQFFLKDKYEVVTFSRSEAALQAAAQINPDIILTDVLMPEMTGYDFLVSLKGANSALKHVPIIVMSTRETLKEIFDAQTMMSFLPKPFTRDELEKAVSSALMPKGAEDSK